MASKQESSDGYVLSRNYAATSRLNLQHFLWRETFGYLLHPSLKVKEAESLRIADVGSGTGNRSRQWLFDVSREVHASCQLVGLDISLTQAPPPEWLPHNVSMRQWDVLQEPPSDLAGTFDVVQARLLLFVVKNNDPAPILKNLIKLLKPGGYLQWGEPDAESVRLVKSNPSNPSESLERVYADMIGSMALFRPTWVKELYRAVEAEGLTEVINDRQSGPPHVWFAFNQCNMMIFDELLEQGKIPKEKQQEWRQLLDLANKECQQGATMLSDRLHVIGRKPT
ncbi:MAG: hypothetical protein Q9159_000175 [Coniocarpon cinnabarinum]